MKKYEVSNFIGCYFGKWKVLGPYRIEKNVEQWYCRCDCGTERYVNRNNLLNGCSQSCGCKIYESAKKRRKDLTGIRFGRLIAIKVADEKVNGRIAWECKCDCGNICIVTQHQLATKKTRSCGCLHLHNEKKLRDIKGKKFDKLLPLEVTKRRDKKGSAYWRCQCDCGNIVEVTEDALVFGNTKSCGCLKKKNQLNIHSQLTFVDGTCIEILKYRKHRSDSSALSPGVYKRNNKYRAYIGLQGERYYLGSFENYEEALNARNDAEKILHQGFIDCYNKWENIAKRNPEWGKANKFYFRVKQKEKGDFVIETTELE